MAEEGTFAESRMGFLPFGGGAGAGVTVAYPDLPITDAWHWLLELHSADGELLHYLEKAFDCGYEVQVNSIGRLWASVPVDATKWPDILEGRELCLRERNQLPKVFVIRNLEHSEMPRRGTICRIDADEIIAVLNDDIIETDYIAEATVTAILTYILGLQTRANPIILGGVDGALEGTINVNWTNRPTLLKAVRDVRDRVGGIVDVVVDEVDQTIRKLWLRNSIGEDKGQQVRVGKNITGIRKIQETRGTATKLYPVGMANEVPLNLSALHVEDEIATKSSDANYGYLTLGGLYSRYKGWSAAGGALPNGFQVWKDAVLESGVWVQGADAQTVRCDIGDYDGGAVYTLHYWHADYIQTTPGGSMHAITRQYPRQDISDPSDLLDAARTYLTTWGASRTSYKITLPSQSADSLDFESLRLGSTIDVIAESLGINSSVAINRLVRRDVRKPQQMEIEVVRTLPIWRVYDPSNQALSKDPMRLYDTAWGSEEHLLGIGGLQVGCISFTPSENYALRYIRLGAWVFGDLGPSVTVALLKSTQKAGYYDGSAILVYRRVGPGVFLGSASAGVGFSERIPLYCLMESGVNYWITMHAPQGDVGAGNYLASFCDQYSVDHGQNWTPFDPPTNYLGTNVLEAYGVPREE